MLRARRIKRIERRYQTKIYANPMHSLSRLPRYSSFASFKAACINNNTMMANNHNLRNQINLNSPDSYDDEENPLVKALPPATDYLTYLTVLEYSLTAERLPTLHGILQDTTLTSNIGWDLVHLLLPLLPASHDCLQDVARLGNPREVVLKVTEHLEDLRVVAGGIDAEEIDEEETGEEEGVHPNDSFTHDDETGNKSAEGDGIGDSSRPKDGKKSTAPTKQSQFIALLEMLSTLHPRIKTAYPSRFLSTSIPAILGVYTLMPGDFAATEAVLGLIKSLSGIGRPKLPPRKSSSIIPLKVNTQVAPDPESQDDALGPDELALQNRLLQAFLVAIVKDYMSSTYSTRDIPGLAWCSRLQEKLHPKTLVPDRQTYSDIFAEEDEFQGRDAIMGQIVALSRDLKIDHKELLSIVTKPETESFGNQEDLPDSPSQVPLHQAGCLYLLSAITAASSLFDVPTNLPSIGIFPEYAAVVSLFIGASSISCIGSERAYLVDAVLFLGFFVLTHGSQSRPSKEDEEFHDVLQRLSILSAENPSPTLRYHAHVLTSSILKSHPSDKVRLAFIRDTLEHCPYESLKASAVGWLKHELLTAGKGISGSSPSNRPVSGRVFTSSSTISTLFPCLFPNPRLLHSSADAKYQDFFAHYSFYLATLNLSFLLLSSPTLFSSLHISALVKKHDFRANFLRPLADMEEEMGNPKMVGTELSEEVLLGGMIQIVDVALQGKDL